MKQTTRIALACLASSYSRHSPTPLPSAKSSSITSSAGEYVLEEIMADPATAIPVDILNDAQGIIFTLNYRGGIMIGGHAGNGILIAKNPITKEWGVPAFVRTGGANIGFQLGVKEFDAVYVIMDLDTVRKAYTGRIDFGADAAAVAGPLESSSEARQSIDFKNAKILVYSNKKGLYAGVSLKAGWGLPQQQGHQAILQYRLQHARNRAQRLVRTSRRSQRLAPTPQLLHRRRTLRTKRRAELQPAAPSNFSS